MDGRDPKTGRFVEGYEGGPGAPTLASRTNSHQAKLDRALLKREMMIGKTAEDEFVEEAAEEPSVRVALMRKILPDMKQVEVTRKYEGGYAEMTPAEACAAMDSTVPQKPNPAEV